MDPPLLRTMAGRRPLGQLWSIVLAGGEGLRLRSLTRRICGDERPKQYVPLVDSRSMLRHTLDRVARTISPERTIVSTRTSHGRYLDAELANSPAPRVLLQPADRGTAAGILYPAYWVYWHDPDATVAIFPSDHFILEEAAFMRHVMQVAAFVSQDPRWVVLLGAQPDGPELEYGWIIPGGQIDGTGANPIWHVEQFCEKPSRERARASLRAGGLWNTLVAVSKVTILLDAGRQYLPALSDRLAHLKPFVGTEDERWATQQAYALAPEANFSRAILEPCPSCLAVSRLPALTWSDWGTPRGVLRSLASANVEPPWRSDLESLTEPG